MKFTQVMGIIYLVIFLGLLAYKLTDALSSQQEPFLIGMVFLCVFLIILMLVRKITYH